MQNQKLIEFAQRMELFAELSPEELDAIVSLFRPCEFKPQQMLFVENTERQAVFFISEGAVELFKTSPYGDERRLTYFKPFDFLGEGSLVDNSPHSTSARAMIDIKSYLVYNKDLLRLFESKGGLAVKVLTMLTRVISRRMSRSNSKLINISEQYTSGSTRREHDLLGYREVPAEALYGIQTLRAVENFNISGVPLAFYPVFIRAFAMVKKAAAKANRDLGLISDEVEEAISKACDDLINGRHHKEFVVDMIQGGAGTSTNMNVNEVVANLALEYLGHKKGQYKHCHPNNHVNLSQSTNDAYPTAVNLALYFSNEKLIEVLLEMIESFRAKGNEFAHIIKMGRTQLQDAVPMTLGQSFEAYAVTLEEEIDRLLYNGGQFLEVNLGATAIGTGINTEPEYLEKVIGYLREVTGLSVTSAVNLMEATQDTSAFLMYSSSVKRLAVKLSKICNDLRLLSSGPRAGIGEINLPPMQPGSSIMPGKVNPVIPEVVNQIAFKVIGNDLTVTLAAEAGQLELNVMEPIIVQSLFESIEMIKNGLRTLRYRCVDGITANEEHCRRLVMNSIGLVTALNPFLGYEVSTQVAKEALETGRGVYDLVLEKGLLSKSQLDEILKPENMISPRKFNMGV